MGFMKIIDIGNFTLYINYLRWQFTNLRSYSRQFFSQYDTADINKVLIRLANDENSSTVFRMR